jgi:predicted phosphodiesterase
MGDLMKIQILSDIHMEMGINPLLKNFKPAGDVLILAGDITNWKGPSRVETVFGDSGVPIIYVPGNHEFYGTDHRTGLLRFRDWFTSDKKTCKSDIHFLDNAFVDINGVRFIGSTYWSHVSPLEQAEVHRCVADFHVISGMTVDHQRRLHEEAKRFIKFAAEEARAKGLKTVVVTHFPPSWQAREERFKASALGSYFYNEDDQFVELIDPAVWIYGHTHGNLEFKCGNVPVVTNQMGYTRGTLDNMRAEPCFKDFDIDYVVEV